LSALRTDRTRDALRADWTLRTCSSGFTRRALRTGITSLTLVSLLALRALLTLYTLLTLNTLLTLRALRTCEPVFEVPQRLVSDALVDLIPDLDGAGLVDGLGSGLTLNRELVAHDDRHADDRGHVLLRHHVGAADHGVERGRRKPLAMPGQHLEHDARR